MQRTVIASMLLMLMASCGGGGSGGTSPPPPAPPTPAGPTPAEELEASLQGLALDEFFHESYRALILRTPESVVGLALGDLFPLPGVDLDNLSDDYRRDTFAMYQVVLDSLRSYDRGAPGPDGQLNYDVYEWHLQDVVDSLEFIYYDFPATYSIFGIPEDTRQFFTDIHPLATLEDAENYVTRLDAVLLKFQQLSDHLVRQRAAGVVEPALSLQIALNQVAAIAQGGADTNPYFTAFSNKLDAIAGLSAADRQRLRDDARGAVVDSVIPGYQALRQTMQDLLTGAPSTIGIGQFPRGNAYYAYTLRHHTTTNRSAADIHQLGLDELARIRAEMRMIFDQLGYPQNESLQQLFTRVTQDGGVIPAADALPTFESIIAAAESGLDAAFDISPSANVIVVPDDFGGYYIGPSFDGARPGAFYAGTRNDQPWFQMPSLAYHEAVPGHHTQIALAMEQDVPAFRKLVRFTAFVEGWALYAERLAFELGWYDNDPYGNLGRLQYEALRAARLVIDTGIHSLGWSFDQAVQFNNDNVGWTTGESQGAAARYSVNPGQATAYMIGTLQILAERQRAMDALGADFDLRDFHRTLLTNGALPLALLPSVIDNYIADTPVAP